MAMFGDPLKASGGSAIRFFASTRNRVRKTETLTKNGIDIGIHIKVRNLKNKTGVPWREADMDMYFDGGFQTDSEYSEFIIKYGLVTQAGAYYKSEKYGFSLCGKDALVEWLTAHPTEYGEFKAEVDKLQLIKTDLDKNNVDPLMTGEDIKDTEDFSPEALAEAALNGEPPTIESL